MKRHTQATMSIFLIALCAAPLNAMEGKKGMHVITQKGERGRTLASGFFECKNPDGTSEHVSFERNEYGIVHTSRTDEYGRRVYGSQYDAEIKQYLKENHPRKSWKPHKD